MASRFTKEEKIVLRLLVEKELEHIKKDSKKLLISNSPFLGKMSEEFEDIALLKSESEYLKFLQVLRKKI